MYREWKWDDVHVWVLAGMSVKTLNIRWLYFPHWMSRWEKTTWDLHDFLCILHKTKWPVHGNHYTSTYFILSRLSDRLIFRSLSLSLPLQAFRFMVGPGHCPMISKYGPSLSKAVGPVDPFFLVVNISHFNKKYSSYSESTNSTKQKVHVGCQYSKTCLKQPLKKRQNKDFNDKW